nr:MAG TPA: hypothetical protein [Caudoviricetes sp.]DAY15945.1 MAG TPA: hypothetical protein [Caudoviricetes sp.]
MAGRQRRFRGLVLVKILMDLKNQIIYLNNPVINVIIVL